MSEDEFKHPEPYKTKTRDEVGDRDKARAWLDEGGHLEAPEEMLYRHMRESQRRLMVLLPTTLWAGITHLKENEGIEMSPEILIALERSGAIASRYLNPIKAEDTIRTILRDSQRLLTRLNADSVPQAILGMCNLILKFADEMVLPDPQTQCVLVSIAILEEAQNDAAEGIKGTWDFDPAKIGKMENEARQTLGLWGYR